MGAPDAERPAPALDAWDELARANTREDELTADGQAVSLELAAVQCEHAYGGAWYCAPSRWPTPDGVVPYKLLWIYWRALRSAHAADALSTAHGISLAFGDGETGQQARLRAVRESLGSK